VAQDRRRKRHHFIPRLLLRGFAVEEANDRVWLYRLGKEPLHLNIKNVAVERGFYDRDQGDDVEDALSRWESGFGATVNRLRKGESCNSEDVASFVINMMIRTRNLRDNLAEAARAVPGMLERQFMSPEMRRSMRKKAEKTVKKTLRKFDSTPHAAQVRKALGLPTKGRITRIPDATIDLALGGAAETLGVAGPEVLGRFLATALDEQLNSGAMDGAHVDSVAKSDPAVRTPRTRAYSRLRWRTVSVADHLVLGDVGPIARFRGSNDFHHPLDRNAEETLQLMLPIAANRLLLGCSDGAAEPPDVRAVNEASAELSGAFFVSGARSDDIERLQGRIRSRWRLLTDDQLNEIEKTMFAEPRGRRFRSKRRGTA